jgi:hypothetical protein
MLALLTLVLTGCLSTSVIERWKDPSFAGPALHRVLVVGVQRDGGQRRVWESSMVAALARQHIAATASYEIFADRAPNADQLAQTAAARGFDGVLATHFVGAHTSDYWTPGPGFAGVGFGWRWRYYGYWDSVYGPGWVDTAYIADFQTDVFTVSAGGRLIWTGITRSVNLNSLEATTDQISRVLVPELVHAGVVASS